MLLITVYSNAVLITVLLFCYCFYNYYIFIVMVVDRIVPLKKILSPIRKVYA